MKFWLKFYTCNLTLILYLTGHVEVLEKLREDHKDIYMEMLEETDAGGHTAYLLACQHGKHKIVKTLILHGEANIQAKSAGGRNGFMLACWHGHLQVVNLLLALTGDSNNTLIQI